MDKETKSSSPLRYNPSEPWEGKLKIIDSTRSWGTNNDVPGRAEFQSHRIVLGVRLEPAAEADADGGRGFSLHVQPEAFPWYTDPDGPRTLDDARKAAAGIRAVLRFDARGVLEECEFSFPPECPREIDHLAESLELLLPLIVPPLPEQPVDHDGWTATQYIASDLIWNWRSDFRFMPESVHGGAVCFRVDGNWEGESAKNPDWIGSVPLNHKGELHMSGPRGIGFVRLDLHRPITRYGVYSVSDRSLGKFPRGSANFYERDIVIITEEAPAARQPDQTGRTR